MTVPLPSEMVPFEAFMKVTEAVLWLISIIVNGLFVIVLKETTTVHRNLRLLIINLIIVYSLLGVSRWFQVSDRIFNYIPSTINYWVILIRRILTLARTACEGILLIERVFSTVFAHKYENNQELPIAIFLILVCYSYPIMIMLLMTYNIVGSIVFLPAPVILNVLFIIFAYCLFKYNKRSYVSEWNQNRHHVDLSKRYQTAENIRTLRTICWFFVYCILSNTIPVCLNVFYVFYIDANQLSELYAYFDATWYLLRAFTSILLPLPFVATHETMKKKFMKLVYRKTKNSSPTIIVNAAGEKLLNQDTHHSHFKSLYKAWEGPGA